MVRLGTNPPSGHFLRSKDPITMGFGFWALRKGQRGTPEEGSALIPPLSGPTATDPGHMGAYTYITQRHKRRLQRRRKESRDDHMRAISDNYRVSYLDNL
ncbi:hypothetical protein SUGI_0994640 [Cryptomeria japonica]|nr:hypothetical protein SUGI_0994640 [Cryptomeria japonica]